MHVISFKKGDAVSILRDYAGQFDIIQCRSVAKHVRTRSSSSCLDAELEIEQVPDAALLTRNIGKALRPGNYFASDNVERQTHFPKVVSSSSRMR